MKQGFSNVDVFAIAKELNQILVNATILNVYELEDLLLLKLNVKQLGRKNLIIKNDSRINLTEYDYPIPQYPSQYIMSIRKFLKNRRILSVSQHNFDRIIIIELTNFETEPWKFVIELFNKGNFLLLDENNTLKIARKYKKYRDRDILANREYIFPKSRGIDFLTINQNEFKELIINSEEEIVRILARNINIAGLYSEEICLRSNIEKKTPGNKLSENKIEELFNSFKKIRNELVFGEIKAQLVLDNESNELAVFPFELELFNNNTKRFFDTFNAAVDQFYSKIDSESVKSPTDLKINQKIKSQEKILKNQQDYLEELKEKKKKYYSHGEFLYANFSPLEKLLNVIIEARKKHFSWEEINIRLENAKQEGMDGIEFFKKIVPATKQLIINIENEDVYLNLKESIGVNANTIYEKGKKAERKIKGTIPAIEQTKKILEELKIEKEAVEVEINFLIKKPKKKWYEKFHWFFSSDGFLTIGGKDATSNEIIYKKYMDSSDLVFHTNFPGSPLTIIKNPDNIQIPDSTLKQAADFVASYSRAWKENWGIVDVFYVEPEQVSKTPPSGEFLPKGSFMMAGKKNFIKNAKTELVISLNIIELESESEETPKVLYPKITCRPKSSVKTITMNDLVIKPSKTGLSKGKLANKIKNFFLSNSDKELKKWIKLLSVDDILIILPAGSSMIKKK